MKLKMNFLFSSLIIILLVFMSVMLEAQDRFELNSGWKCLKASETDKKGEDISLPSFPVNKWMDAVVPGTVLTTQLQNHLIPDPNFSMNNEKIPDIYTTGNDYYTYWFAKDIDIKYPDQENQVWLEFRGVNYSCNVFLNGHQLNQKLHKGMFLRQAYNITPFLSKDGKNRIAVIVYPPDPPGNPNGGQGGDGVIAKNVTMQFVDGWDWIQPVRDRNTGIWDKVYIERTGPVNIKNPHVVTEVEGVRYPDDPSQKPVVIKVTTEVQNAGNRTIPGELKYSIGGKDMSLKIAVPAKSELTVHFPDLTLEHPKLWWPNGYGPQDLYDLKLEFRVNSTVVSDSQTVKVGIRQIETPWNPITQSRQFEVNGQKILIKGGNWIASDAMLRLSKERYDAEVRFHRDANLNLIRIWGGSITERPEFYEACDQYGMLVWQEFWMSGDCNGRWQDQRKKDDQWDRRKYPDDHLLFIQSAVDMVKLIRNHPSLAIWCGGNEITPPNDINEILKDTLASELDGTRIYLESSTTGDLYYNFKGSTGDGPYGIQPLDVFWSEKSYPFNPELGSIGMGDYESLKRIFPDSSMVIPGKYKSKTNEKLPPWRANIEPNWDYHKISWYAQFPEKYGDPQTVPEYAKIAQLINFNQYRALAEGFTSHMFEWYTGFIIWKTQNPWTALRGQLYDWYLDPNACLYGLHHGSEPFHIMMDPADGMIMVANNTFTAHNNLMVIAKGYDMNGKVIPFYQQWVDVSPTSIRKVQSIERGIKSSSSVNGLILSLKMFDSNRREVGSNLYWLPDSTGNFPMLQHMKKAAVEVKAKRMDHGKISVIFSNTNDNPLAFFIRISLVDTSSGKRILPVFYSDNYISIEPGDDDTVIIEPDPSLDTENAKVEIEGWNVDKRVLSIE